MLRTGILVHVMLFLNCAGYSSVEKTQAFAEVKALVEARPHLSYFSWCHFSNYGVNNTIA